MEGERSCIDCGRGGCGRPGKGRPGFCLTDSMDPTLREESVRAYEGEDARTAVVAAEIERDGYGVWCRVRELVEFARRMGYRRIGIATCVGLLRESCVLADILRSNGLEVYGIACKAGTVPKTSLGIDPSCNARGEMACNPILQAMTLNREGTDLNVIVGLCIGHDILFTKHSDAPVTTLVVKDRVLVHNTVAALYNADSYYANLRGDRDREGHRRDDDTDVLPREPRHRGALRGVRGPEGLRVLQDRLVPLRGGQAALRQVREALLRPGDEGAHPRRHALQRSEDDPASRDGP